MPIEIHGDGEQTRDYIYVLDTVKYILELSINDELIGRTVNIGSGVETSVISLVKQILKLMKKENILCFRKEEMKIGKIQENGGGQ